MPQPNLPILYSFRRCPFAMRARMAVQISGIACELREIVLRAKPEDMLKASPKGTVPVLVLPDGTVIDESIDIMRWALGANDPEAWLKPETGSLDEMQALIDTIEGPFKGHLDRYKYATRYTHENAGTGVDPETHRSAAIEILAGFDHRLAESAFLFGSRRSLVDVATAPFVRQFANTDPDWFAGQRLPGVQRWLAAFVASDLFLSVMQKYKPWQSGTPGLPFPEAASA